MKRSSPRKTLLAAATIAALGATASVPADAAVLEFNWAGYFTMLASTGNPLVNTDYQTNSMAGNRTDITGTMTFDTNTGAGSATINPFYFFNGSYMVTSQFDLQAIGDGFGNQGSLVLGNLALDWGANNIIPASIVLDAAGLFGTMMTRTGPFSVGQTISGVGTYGASDGMSSGAYHMGLLPVSTTTWNTTTIPGTVIGSYPSGTLPLIADTTLVTNYDGDPLTAGYQNACAVDAVPGTKSGQAGWQCALGVGGSPMPTAPFQGFSANIDIASLTYAPVVCVGCCTGNAVCPSPVPVPAAVWLLGSGLLGLIGLSRWRKA